MLGILIVCEQKIAGSQVVYKTVMGVGQGNIDQHQIDIGLECVLMFRLARGNGPRENVDFIRGNLSEYRWQKYSSKNRCTCHPH